MSRWSGQGGAGGKAAAVLSAGTDAASALAAGAAEPAAGRYNQE